ncbi:MAG: cobalamin biosynthesis protein P47K [Parasporobacterium sp.]|nr:cobalamin biosynthesis protein P47K [Parasporobacterium sp.]
MRLVILGGFLGTGKTSVLMPVARQIVEAAGGGGKTRVAIIENEIGQVGIDTAFTEGAGFTTTELFNGCVCCTLASSLMDSLCQLERDVDPEWVILETTGLARPHDIAESIRRYYDENMNTTVCITVDVNRWNRLKKVVGELLTEQIENADYVFLNKIDLADAETIAAVRKDIEELTKGKVYEISAKADTEGTEKICLEIIKEIISKD